MQHDLAAPVGTEVGEQLADSTVTAQIAARGRQRRRDVLDDVADAERVGDDPRQTQALGIGILFRHEDAQHVAGPKRGDTQGGGEARIYASRQADDGSTPAQTTQDLVTDPTGDRTSGEGGIETQAVGREFSRIIGTSNHGASRLWVSATRRRLIFPESVLGSEGRNSTNLGTM